METPNSVAAACTFSLSVPSFFSPSSSRASVMLLTSCSVNSFTPAFMSFKISASGRSSFASACPGYKKRTRQAMGDQTNI